MRLPARALECARWDGKIINASTNEILRVAITTKASSPKKSAILPSRKKNEEKAIIVVRMADTMAGTTSMVPSMAACIAFFPFS